MAQATEKERKKLSGIHGRLLQIDLTKNEIKPRVDIDENIWRKYLGASGVSAHILLSEFDTNIEPLAPEAPMVWMAGLLTGTMAPTGCKFTICCRSPLTGIWNESTGGGQFGAKMRFTGNDGLILTGRAAEPSYIYINEDNVEIRPCQEIWEEMTIPSAKWLKAQTHPTAECAVIGPAAVRGVKYAGIMTGAEHTRAAARSGVGTVLASKNIKAIVVKGNLRPPIADYKGFVDYVKEYNVTLKKNGVGMWNFGTSGGLMGVEANGDLSIKNWQLGAWKEGAEAISAQKMAADGFVVGHHACFACALRCAKMLEIKDDKWDEYKGLHIPQQEYETSAGFGGNLLIDDHQAVTVANYLCNQYGLDTMSTAASIAFAFEAFEKGIITEKDTDGVALNWGDAQAMVAMIKMIGEARGIGKLLGQGVREAARQLGQGSEEFAVHVKGLEVAFHDPRAFTSMGPGYATGNRGACHLENLTYFAEQGVLQAEYGYTKGENPFAGHWGESEGKAELCKKNQDYMNGLNAVGICKFAYRVGATPTDITKWINFVTGWGMTVEEFLLASERLHSLKRIFNVRLGITAKDDVLPPRLGTFAKVDGKAAGVLPDMEVLLPAYYQHRGWNENGVPSDETLARLGLMEYDMSVRG